MSEKNVLPGEYVDFNGKTYFIGIKEVREEPKKEPKHLVFHYYNRSDVKTANDFDSDLKQFCYEIIFKNIDVDTNLIDIVIHDSLGCDLGTRNIKEILESKSIIRTKRYRRVVKP